MRIHNLIKNIFLISFLLLISIGSVNVNAAYDYGSRHADTLKKAGWTNEQINKIDENVNDLSSGSTGKISKVKDTLANKALIGAKWSGLNMFATGAALAEFAGLGVEFEEVSENLYKNIPNKIQITDSELSALKTKLKEGGSTANQDNLKQDNVYQINTEFNSSYVYDPTPGDKTNNDEVVLGVATKEGSFSSFKTPIKKEVSGRTYDENRTTKDTGSLDGVLNAIDVKNGRQSGTSVSAKNTKEDLVQERINLEAEHNRALEAYRQAQKERRVYEAGNNIDLAILEALKHEEDLKKGELDKQKELTRNIDEQRAAEQARRDGLDPVPELGEKECTGKLNAFSNSYFCITVWIAKLTNIIFKLVSFIAYINGTLFDYSLELSINSAEFLDKLGVIEITWSFIRDVLNMTFIFILLWTAVQILIGNGNAYNAQKILRNVIIVAILMNFSLFAAKLMVDTSNIVSLKIYEAMKANTEDKGSSISVRVMNTVGLTTLYDITEIFNADKIQAQGLCAKNPGALITVSVMGSIFLIILCMALGLAAILFLVRLVNIVFLFIKSPLWVWGHVIPGNPRIEKFKNDWWSQMLHVLTFPILYLFWMLIAIIVFEKLGSAKNGDIGLLSLICDPKSAGDINQSISLVAIFAIVIIFMMKAIEYGFKHAGDGGPDTFGSKFSSNIAGKFSGYQTAMTKGLFNKSTSAVKNIGVRSLTLAKDTTKGTAGLVGRTGVGLIQGAFGKKNFQAGFADGFSNPSINAKELLRDTMQNVKAKTANNGLANVLGVTGLAAKLAQKYDDPTNSAGETRKKADERRTAKAVEDETRRAQAIDKAYKILNQKDWEKQNRGGTTAQYKKHIEDMIEKRTIALLGSADIANEPGKNGKSHLENLRKAAVEEYKEDIKDASGNVIGQADKIRFKEHAMHKALQDVINHEATGEMIKKEKTKYAVFRNIKAKARIKAIEGEVKERVKKTRDKETEENKTKKYAEDIKNLEEEKNLIPDPSEILTAVNSLSVYVHTPVTGPAYNGKKLRDVNMAIAEYNAEAGRARGARPDKLLKLENKLKDKYEAYNQHVKKINSELSKKQTEYNEHLSRLDEKNK